MTSMLIATLALPGLAIEAHQERGQVRLTIVLASVLPRAPRAVIETTGTETEESDHTAAGPGLAKAKAPHANVIAFPARRTA